MVDFPFELVERFLFHIDQDPIHPRHRLATLLNCCRVCRLWSSVAQPLLFSAITVKPVASRTRMLHQRFQADPQLRRYVKALCLTADLSLRCRDVDSVISSLPNLKRLLLLSSFSHTQDPATALQTQLPRLFRSRYLTSLSLCGLLDISCNLFYHCQVLEELAIKRTTFTVDAAATLPPESLKSRLQRFVVSYGRDSSQEEFGILHWMIGPKSAFNLEDLKMFLAIDHSDGYNSSETICRFIPHVAAHIQTFLLVPFNNPPPPSLISKVNSDRFHNLRVATIILRQEVCVSGSRNMVPWLLNWLSNLPHPERLEGLVLPMSVQVNVPTEFYLRKQGWADLDALLNLQFPNLRTLCIFVEACTGWKLDVCTYLQSYFPALANRNILCLRNFDYDSYISQMEAGWFDDAV
ncbi:hypothetical protein BDN72DRAFT_962778 [Pluteus cervinus]|uniref:Uncharacterized protein n=1 Tax=Pluteus cervinus TaxID=181527 RepID=A0ACD3AH38_9AGAR|nr:hypothetical protein BDN72DRAFT_962778 [Pluteus cervinus]